MEDSNYPELFADLAAVIAQQLVDKGIETEKASGIGFDVAEHFRTSHWAGQHLYFGKGQAYDLDRKYMEIWNKFNGRNHAALAREYDLTVIRIYQIIKAVRAVIQKKQQPLLF